jgi:DNA-binding NarL/FixJ family response regulator
LRNPEDVLPASDPWRDDAPVVRIYTGHALFRRTLAGYLGDAVQFTEAPEPLPREALLDDCTEGMGKMPEARRRFPTHPVVAVLGGSDPAQIIEALASGADGVIGMTDPPTTWRECLNVVLGGGRWLGGPGLDVSLEQKYARYDITTHDRHKGDVTLRTKVFVNGRLADKPGH